MSQLEVDKIIPQSGTTLTIGDSGDTVNFADGTNLSIDTNTLYIDSTNNRVGIGTASPGSEIHAIAQDVSESWSAYDGTVLTIENNDTDGCILQTVGRNTATNEIWFGDDDSRNIGRIRYEHTDDVLELWTNNSEAMRINSSGDLMVGTTANLAGIGGSSTQGVALSSGSYGGLVAVSRSGNPPIIANRQTSDGTIQEFRKDGTTVGTIGVNSGNNPYFSGSVANHGGVMFSDAGASQPTMLPVSSGSTLADNSVNIGVSSYRYKDLYLGGGLYVGGTGSANYLDDYEEGTFNPTLTPSTSGSLTINNSANELKYTKIGNTVFVQGRLEITGSSSPVGSNLNLGNMPFTPVSSSEGSGWFGGMCAISNDGSATFQPFTVWALTTTVKITTTIVASMGSNTRLHFNFFYETS